MKAKLPSLSVEAGSRVNIASYSVGVKDIFLPEFEQFSVKVIRCTAQLPHVLTQRVQGGVRLNSQDTPIINRMLP